MEDPDSIEYSVLGLLYDQPLHGYELFRHYSGRSGLSLIWKVKRGRFYAILARMARRGMVDMEVLKQEQYPARKIFSLTPDGLSAFRSWMVLPVADSRAFRVEFPAKLFFAQRLDPEAAERLLADQKAVCKAWLREKEAAILADPDAGTIPEFDDLVLRFRAGQLRAMTEWLTLCEDYLRTEKRLPVGTAVEGETFP